MVTEEKEEDRPQIVQLKSSDLGEKEYNQLRDKEAIESSFSSFGKILFKKPTKKTTDGAENDSEPTTSGTQEKKQEKISAELDSIFDLSKKKEEEEDVGEEKEPDAEKPVVVEKKKIYLEDEEKTVESHGLQPPTKKTRLVDRIAENKVANSLSAAKVLAREAKAGNRKLLSFYDEEEEENEEYRQECFKEKLAKEDDDDDAQ